MVSSFYEEKLTLCDAIRNNRGSSIFKKGVCSTFFISEQTPSVEVSKLKKHDIPDFLRNPQVPDGAVCRNFLCTNYICIDLNVQER